MKVIAGYMLAVAAGSDSPSVNDVKKIYESVGIEMTDDEHKRLEELVEEMVGKDINEILAAGNETLKTVPMGGGGGGGGGAAAGGAAPAAGGAAAAAPEEEEEEEEELAPAADLFGGGDDY